MHIEEKRRTMSCSYCNETETSKIEKVLIIYQKINPLAYGYPEVCQWNEGVEINYCPVCQRIIKSESI